MFGLARGTWPNSGDVPPSIAGTLVAVGEKPVNPEPPTEPTGRQLAEEPSLWGRVAMERAERIADAPANTRREELLNQAARALGEKLPTAHDAAWRALHQVRHLDCQHAEQSKLIQISSDLIADVKYHPQKEALQGELDQVSKTLAVPLDNSKLDALRPQLMRLSTIAAEERESMWRQANRIIARRKKASRWAVLVALALTVAMPLASNVGASVGWMALRYITAGLCGALGGLLSGLFHKDRLNAPSIEHHIEQTSFELRPSIGFVAAIIAMLVAETGALKSGDIAEGLNPTLRLLAVSAGFSERFLIAHIDKAGTKS